MTWALIANGTNQYLTLETDVTLVGFYELTFEFNSIMGAGKVCDSFTGSVGRFDINLQNNGVFQARPYCSFEVNGQLDGVVNFNEPVSIKIYRDSLNTDQSNRSLYHLLTRYSIASNLECELIKVTLINGTGGENFTIDATASDHNGTTDQPILIDNVGDNNATGVNFPSFDPTVWVDLGGSGTGASGDIDFTITKPVFNASGAATLPQPLAAIDFTVSKPLFSVEGGASLPQPVGVVDFTVSKPIFSVDGSVSLPSPQATISFDVEKPVFNVTGSATSPNPAGNIDFTIDKPAFTVNGSATLPQPSANISFDISKPEFSLTGGASLPYPQATIAFDISKPVFNVNGSVTLPQPSGSVSFEISKPIFNVTGSVSGFNVPIGSTIKLEVGSNVIKLPYASNTIKL